MPPFKIEKSENLAGSYFSEISDSAGFYFSEKLPRIWAGFYFLVKNFNFALFLHCKMPKIFPARFARRGFIFLTAQTSKLAGLIRGGIFKSLVTLRY